MDQREQEPEERQTLGQALEEREVQHHRNLDLADTKEQYHKVQQELAQHSCCKQVGLELERHRLGEQRRQGARGHRRIVHSQEHRMVAQR